MNETPKSRGRPTKYTAITIKAICDGIADGLSYSYAAANAGISHETLCQWQRKYPDFSEAIQKAVAKGISSRLKLIISAAEKGDVKAAQWWLEHVHPDQYSKSRIDIKHHGSVEHQFSIPSEILQEIALARANHENASNSAI